MTTLNIKLENVNDVIADFNAKPGQVERAGKRAINKTLDRIQSAGFRELSKAHDIPAKALRPRGRYRGRVVKRRPKRGASGYVWFGRNPVKTGYIGSLRQAPDYGGAFARKYFFQGGFLVALKSGHTGIFKRKGKSRLPIFEETVALAQAETVIKKIANDKSGDFKKIFARELNYEVNVRGKR